MKNKTWDIAVLVFLGFLLLFGLLRAKHDLRWSAWALGDAQNMNSSIHFADEGFKTHYFLTYYHPGYLGKSFGNESEVGYYTRYPPLSAIWNGFLIKHFGADVTCLKQVSVILACLGLLFAYWVFGFFFNKRVSFLAMFFIGSSVAYLEFLDCLSPYMYSEFFRFGALFFFLLAEKKDKTSPKIGLSKLLFAAAWVLTFLESFNSFDYIVFLQLFFLLYYLLIEKKVPIAKICFWASAPLVGLVLHYTQGALALEQYDMSATGALFKAFGEKTAPFHKGLLHVLSFITYFFRIMEGHFVNSNFGFGFGLVAALGGIYCFTKSENSSWRVLLLFVIPSISWWFIFPNQSASFFNTPMHFFPVVGILFGLAADFGISSLTQTEKKELRLAGSLVLIAVFWHVFLFTGKYLKEYPNLLNPSKRTTAGGFAGMKTEQIQRLISVSKALKGLTQYGDIILVPKAFKDEEHFYEYYSQRRMDYYGGQTPEALKQKLENLESYRKEGATKYPIFNSDLSIYILIEDKTETPISQFVKSKFKSQSLEDGWLLINPETGI